MEPYMYKRSAEKIIYHIQSKLQMEISEDLKHDIYSNVLQAVHNEADRAREREEYWYRQYCMLQAKGFPLNWNEMRLRIRQEKEPIPSDVLLNWMLLRENGKSIRGPILNDEEVAEKLLEDDLIKIYTK